MKKPLSLILALLMLALSSCGGNETDTNTEISSESNETSAEISESEETEAETLKLGLPEGLDYNGAEIRILTPTAEAGDSFITEVNGDLVNDALFNRDRTVESLLDVTLKPISYANGPDYNKLQQSILAGDNAYDFMHLQASTYFANRPSYEKILLDVSDAQYLDLNAPWWNTDAINELSYNGKSIKYLIGDISLTSISGASVFFYNKDLFDDIYHDPELPYNDVIEGKWTIDKFSEYCAGAYSDTNGDGTADVDDFYGTMMNPWMLVSFYNGFSDTRFYSRDDNGYVQLDLDTERVVTFSEKLYDLVWSNSGVYLNREDQWHNTAVKLFSENGTLFMAWFLNAIEQSDMRSMESDYGILPFFKLDESQEEYRSDLNPSGTKWVCVPITCPDVDMVTSVIEALSYYSYYNVTPIYYEEALKTKYTRDAQSGVVIDMVRDSIRTDYLIGIYRSTIGQHFVNMVRDKNQNYISGWEKSVKLYTKTMEKAYSDLDS